jgi:hypothetical protein
LNSNSENQWACSLSSTPWSSFGITTKVYHIQTSSLACKACCLTLLEVCHH